MSSYLLFLLIALPIFGAVIIMFSKYDRNYFRKNIYHVAIWTLLTNISLVLYTFSLFDTEKNGIQLVEKYNWLNFPVIDILLGADTFSMLLLLGINIAFGVADICLSKHIENPKTLLASQLVFIGLLNGYILSADIISFYIFFAALSIPLIVLISSFGSFHKKNMLVRFSLYNLIGTLLLFTAVILMYHYKEGNIPLNTAGNLNLKGKLEYFVWLSLFFSFISRMPIWPFHYWIASISTGLYNPLAFVMSSLIPLVGLYGFMRFWPNTVPESIAVYAPLFETVCIITMLFIALISLNHKDFRYKLFAYTTVYYLLFLIGVFLPTSGLKMNIGYSIFSYIIILTVLSFIISHIEAEKKKNELYSNSGLLCYMPRTSISLSLFILAAIGLPITPLFWNNFIIISEIFNYNLLLGVLVMLSLLFVALALLEELYRMKDKSSVTLPCPVNTDLSRTRFVAYMICLAILFISFVKPLWFVM